MLNSSESKFHESRRTASKQLFWLKPIIGTMEVTTEDQLLLLGSKEESLNFWLDKSDWWLEGIHLEDK